MNTVYIEKAVRGHPRVARILERFGAKAEIIECEHYGEVFNPKNQNFRIQKQNPALILAQKRGSLVLPTPETFGIGGQANYYFSHMLNCLYDCRYCFLQGMYQSANYVLFVNYEDFMTAIAETVKQHTHPVYLFSGYDCDSLAFEPLTHFVEEFLPFFAAHEQAILELRTKSANVQALLNHAPILNCVVAFSFTPEKISRAVEYKVPAVSKRIAAMRALAEKGWKIGLRFDPLIDARDFEEQYAGLIQEIFNTLRAEAVHSVSVGPMRFPVKMYQKLVKLYPREKLLAQAFEKRDAYITYSADREKSMKNFVLAQLENYLSRQLIFECHTL